MLISSPKNPWIRDLRSLHTARGRREDGLFLVEGTHLLQEALATQWPLDAICFTPEWGDCQAERIAGIPDSVRQQPVSPEVLQALATTANPDGVIAVAHRRVTSPVPLLQLGLMLETVQDPGNVGALLRTAAAAGADQLWLTEDCVDTDHPKVLRASAGQWFRLPPTVIRDPLATIDQCRQQGIQIVATSMAAAMPYWDADLTRPTLILLGNEGAGLSPAWLGVADQHIAIPMAPQVESLNVAMTGGLILYEACRQRGFTRF